MTVETMPYIHKNEQTMAPSGEVLEVKTLTVQGKDLDKCRKHFDNLWDKSKPDKQ